MRPNLLVHVLHYKKAKQLNDELFLHLNRKSEVRISKDLYEFYLIYNQKSLKLILNVSSQVALLLFGATKLPEIGKALGKSIKEFRKGIQTEEKNIENKQGGDEKKNSS